MCCSYGFARFSQMAALVTHALAEVCTVPVAVWCSDSALVLINEVNLRRARLVLGWVTGCPGSTSEDVTSFRYVTSHPGRLNLLPSVGWQNEYQLCGCGVKAGRSMTRLRVNRCVAISERFRKYTSYSRRFTNVQVYFTFTSVVTSCTQMHSPSRCERTSPAQSSHL